MVAELKKTTLAQTPMQTHEENKVVHLVLENSTHNVHHQQQKKRDPGVIFFSSQTHVLPDAETTKWLEKYSQSRSHFDNYALPGYFMLTGRKGLHLITNHYGYFPVCQHPNLEEKLLLFPPVGDIDAIYDYLHQLNPWPRNGVQLARIPDKEQKIILDKLAEKWHIVPVQEDTLDWGMHPVRSLPVKEMALREGKQYKNHRRKYNYADKKVKRLAIIEYWNSQKDDKVKKFIYNWAKKKHIHDNSFSLNDYIEPYLNIISIHANPNIRSICLLFENQLDDVMGMVIIEIFNGIAAAYMNIATDEIPYFPAYILMKTCDFLYENKLAEVLCLGGSEKESLDKFKSDLQPCFARTDSRLSYCLNSLLVKPLSERRTH